MEPQDITIEFLKKRPLSYSSLKEFKKSPQHYLHYLFAKRKATDAQMKGSLVDKAILFPDTWMENIAIVPKFDFRKKGTKEAYDAFLEANADKYLATQEDIDMAKIVQENVFRNKIASTFLGTIGEVQREVRWIDKATGLPIVAKLDGAGKESILELKSTKDASPFGFGRECVKYDYPLQAGVYMESEKVSRFRFPMFHYLAVEKEAPYGIGLHKASPKYLGYAKQEFRNLLDRFKYCMDNNLWHQTYEFHSLNHNYLILDLPGYIKFD